MLVSGALCWRANFPISVFSYTKSLTRSWPLHETATPTGSHEPVTGFAVSETSRG